MQVRELSQIFFLWFGNTANQNQLERVGNSPCSPVVINDFKEYQLGVLVQVTEVVPCKTIMARRRMEFALVNSGLKFRKSERAV